ncbi:hypothetical protein JW977_00270 [Candidatus Falkowbacteria bacterium]|nr:hypothetical protein [Candidatus Falkowbacteria bacterium]
MESITIDTLIQTVILNLEIFFSQFSTMTSWEIIWNLLFVYQGWIIYLIIVGKFLIFPEYMFYINNRWFAKNIQMTLLAIDVPRMNEQSIQAMENLFDHLQGAHGTFNWWQTYIDGEFQLSFSCELVSIEGNVQFLVRTPKHLRNLVEAAVYGQFPDAEITEVEDYVNSVPRIYPNETHDVWACEFTLSAKEVYYPLKSYMKFQDRFSETFVDPMAALLETMSSIGIGEQIWIQYLIKPMEVGWGRKGGQKLINKMLDIKEKAPSPGLFGGALTGASTLASEFMQELAGVGWSGGEEKKEEKPMAKMMALSPAQRELLEGIERKISKLAFNTKIRFIYVAEKKHMNKAVGVNAVIGAIKQWTDMNSNGLKPALKETGTNTPFYYLRDYRRNTRRNTIMAAYRSRNGVLGMPAKPLCSEELASLWHFPSINVKAPLLKQTTFKKAAAPVGLPLVGEVPVVEAPAKTAEAIAEKAAIEPTFDYDSDAFEKQFAKDKEAFAASRPEREKRLKEIAAEEKVRIKKQEEERVKKQKEEVKEKETLKETVEVKAKKAKPVIKKKEAPSNLPFME